MTLRRDALRARERIRFPDRARAEEAGRSGEAHSIGSLEALYGVLGQETEEVGLIPGCTQLSPACEYEAASVQKLLKLAHLGDRMPFESGVEKRKEPDDRAGALGAAFADVSASHAVFALVLGTMPSDTSRFTMPASEKPSAAGAGSAQRNGVDVDARLLLMSR
mgnify:CR=1 FL=1